MDEIACLGEIYGDLYGKGIKGCEMEQTANDPKDKKSKQEAMAKRYEALNRITDANRGKKKEINTGDDPGYKYVLLPVQRTAPVLNAPRQTFA